MERRFAVLARPKVVAALLAVSATVAAAPTGGEAKVQFDKGVNAYSKGDFQGAARALAKSYSLKPDSETLFAWAQAERQLEHCEKALELYGKLLKFNMPDANREAVKNQIGECKDILAKKNKTPDKAVVTPPDKTPDTAVVTPPDKTPEKTPDKTPEPDKTTDTRPDSTDTHRVVVGDTTTDTRPDKTPYAPGDRIVGHTESHSWWQDPVGDTLLGLGVAGLGVSAYFILSAQAAESDKSNATSYSEFKALDDKATQRGQVGMIALAAGGVLVATSFTWYATHRHHDRAVVTGWIAPGQGGLAITGGF